MLQLRRKVGEIRLQESRRRCALGRFVNYSEHPNKEPVSITVVQFNPWFNSAAFGDGHGRVTLLDFFSSIIYNRIDVVEDLLSFSQLPRNTNIISLCFSEPDVPRHNSLKTVNQYLFVGIKNFIVGYINRSRVTPPIVLTEHTQNIKSLLWISSTDASSKQSTGLLISGSTDRIVIWNAVQWTKVKILARSRAVYPLKVCPVWLPSHTSNIKLQTSCIGAILSNNTITVWDIEKEDAPITKLKSSAWISKLSNVQLTLLTSNHRQDRNIKLPTSLSKKSYLISAGRVAGCRGVLLIWDYGKISWLISLRDRPIDLRCLDWDRGSYNNFCHVAILLESGDIEIRSLSRVGTCVFIIRPSFIQECHSRFLNESRLRNVSKIMKRGDDLRIEVNVNSKLRGIITFGIDDDRRRIVIGMSDGSVQILMIKYLLQQWRTGDQRASIGSIKRFSSQLQRTKNLTLSNEYETSDHEIENHEVESDHQIEENSQNMDKGTILGETATICSPFTKQNLPIPVPSTLEIFIISKYESILLDIGVPDSLMFLYTHPNSDYGWTNPQSSSEIEDLSIKSPVGSIRRRHTEVLSLFELRNQFLLNPPFHYPHTYRQELWEMILELPKSQIAYNSISELAQVGSHPSYKNLEKRLPIDSEVTLKRMERLLSSIAYWCPELKEIFWLEQLAYTIVSLFDQKPLLCLEIFLSIILWWSFLGCRQFQVNQQHHCNIHFELRDWGWFCGPLTSSPPMGLLCFSSFIFMKEDNQLWAHILTNWGIITDQEIQSIVYTSNSSDDACPIDPIELHGRLGHRILWPLIRSFLSEVFDDLHIQMVFDHIFTSPTRPLLINAAVIAFLSICRTTLLTFRSLREFSTWAPRPHPIPFNLFIEKMYKIDCCISTEYLPAIGLGQSYTGPIDISTISPPVSLKDLGWPILRGSGDRSCKNYPEITFELESLRSRVSEIHRLIETKRTSLLEKLKKIDEEKTGDGLGDDEVETLSQLNKIEQLIRRKRRFHDIQMKEEERAHPQLLGREEERLRKEVEKGNQALRLYQSLDTATKSPTRPEVILPTFPTTVSSLSHIIPHLRPRVMEEDVFGMQESSSGNLPSSQTTSLSLTQRDRLVRELIRGRHRYQEHLRKRRRRRLRRKVYLE